MIFLPSIVRKGVLFGVVFFLFQISLLAQDGKAIFSANCATCHALDKQLTGPALRGVEERGPWNNRANLHKWVHNPGGFIPTTPYTQQLAPLSGFGTRLQVLMASRLRAMRDRSATARAATLGALTTLLPCGWLYAFVVTAGGTGSAVAGMLVMLAFWTGTLPMLLSLGMGVQRAAGPLARRLPLASAVLLVAIGLLSIAGKLHAPAGHGQHAPSIEAHDHR